MGPDRTEAAGNGNATAVNGGAPEHSVSRGDANMVTSTDTLTQSLRGKTGPILTTYVRLENLRLAAQRVHRLAVSAQDAHRQGSLEEATQCLQALDFAMDQASDLTEHATLALRAEMAR